MEETSDVPPAGYRWICSHDCEPWSSEPFRAHVYEHPLTGRQWGCKEPLFRKFGRLLTLEELIG